MSKLVKLSKSENCIDIRTITKKGTKAINSDRFIILKTEIDRLLNNNSIISHDIYSFLTAYIYKNMITIEIYWLNSCSNKKIEGTREIFYIDLNKFKAWYNSNEKKISLLAIKDTKKPCKINFYSKKLKEVLKNKIVRRQLIKQLIHFSNYNESYVNLYDDFSYNSFEFSCYDDDNKFTFNGGLIYHKDSDNKGYYSIHT